MKPQVLILIDSLTCGGAEKSLISLLLLLDYTKIEVDLMIVSRGGVFEQYVTEQVRIVDFPQQGGLMFKMCQLYFSALLRIFPNRHGAELRWQAMGKAYKALDKEYDVAIAYQQGFPTYYVAEKVKAKRKYAWVNADVTKVGYEAEFNRRFYDRYDGVVPVSEKLCEILGESSFVEKSKLYPVYDILNVELIRSMSSTPVEYLHTNKDAQLVIATVGRMVALKGYDLAVNAAKILKTNGVNFLWYFVGDGDQSPVIRQMIKDNDLEKNIIMTGMQPNPYPFMKAADIYVQTSRFEGYGLTVNEARILHKPVVSTNFPVIYNQITDGVNGLIAEMTPESIAEKIMMLMNGDALRERIIDSTKKEMNTTAITEPQKVMSLILQ